MSILRRELDSIEFFTVQATGESGMSQSGLARMCGVKPHAVNQLLKSVITSFCPDFLKPLQEKELTLGTSYHEFKNVTIIKDSVCAVILEWYAFESQRPTEKARQAFRKFAAMGIRTWIQSLTGWENSKEEEIALNQSQLIPQETESESIDNPDIESIFSLYKSLQRDLQLAVKHRHIIHNVVEKPVAVDFSLNRIIHTAIHEQAKKLNRAIASLEQIQAQANILRQIGDRLQQSDRLGATLAEMTNSVQQLHQENDNLKRVIQQQQRLLSSRRKNPQMMPLLNGQVLQQALQPRIRELTAILMRSQKRTGGQRAINTCSKKAIIYARYEIGQSLTEIAEFLQIPYTTVKSYIKLTRREIASYYAAQN